MEIMDMSSGTTIMTKCLGEVRLVPLSSMQAHRTRLQQAWEIIEYSGGKPSARRVEWRDVPTVDER